MKIHCSQRKVHILKRLVLLSVLIFFLFPVFLHAQIKIDTNFRLPVQEKLHYRIYYKLGRLWVYAAFANFRTDTTTFNEKKVYKLYVEAYSRKKFDWIYSLEDHYTSLVDYQTFKPYQFEKYNIEKGIVYHNIYRFNWKTNQILMTIYSSSENDTLQKTEKLPSFITDAFSAVHYIRTWDFSQIKKNKKLGFHTILDGKVFKQEVIYRGTDSISDKNGNKIKAYKLEALIKNSTFFRSDKGVMVWVADNPERWIVKVNAKIIVGSIVVFLDQKGLASFDIH